MTIGYAHHLHLVGKVCSDSSRFLRPEARTEILTAAFGDPKEPELQAIIDQLLAMWGCGSLEELSKDLGAKINAKFIAQVIRGSYPGINPLATLALLSLAGVALKKRGKISKNGELLKDPCS